MTTPATPSSPESAGDDRKLVPVEEKPAVNFEDWLHLFWKRNGNAILVLFAVMILGVLAKGAWDYFAEQRELKIEREYAATKAENLKSFVTAHPKHPLAAVAELRMADEAYSAGKYADAIAGYEKVARLMKGAPLGARAQLGRAIARIQSGKTAEGADELKQLLNDAGQFKAVRAEAGYHLASLAAEARDAAAVQKYSDQLMQIEPGSPWTQRAFELRASLPVAPAAPAGESKPAATEAKKDEAAPGVQFKLPGKKE